MLRPDRSLIAGLITMALTPAQAQENGPQVDFLLRGSGDPVVVTNFDSGPLDEPEIDDTPLIRANSGPDTTFDDGGSVLAQNTAPSVVPTSNIATPIGPAPIGPAMAGPVPGAAIGPPMRGPEPVDIALEPTPPARQSGPDEDPFSAPGIALGTFIVRPTLDVGILATPNADGGRDGPGRIAGLVDGRIEATSDGDTHLVRFEMRGSATLYGDDQIDEQEVDARFLARFDLAGQTTLEMTAGYKFDQTSFTDPDTPGTAVERPGVHTLSAGARIARPGGTIPASLAGSLTRILNEDVALFGGGTANLDERDSTEYAGEARLAIAATPALAPFVAVSGGRVEFDQPVDSGGFQRARNFGEVRGGVTIDRGPKLSGELSAGYRWDEFDDPALAAIDSVVIAADILWSPVRLTQVRFQATSQTDGSFQPGVSGSRNHTVSASISRRFRSRFQATAGGGYARKGFVGLMRTDHTITGYAELVYDMSRYSAIVGRYDYAHVKSDDPAVTGDEHRASLRLRMKR